jgi:hypothetical protein
VRLVARRAVQLRDTFDDVDVRTGEKPFEERAVKPILELGDERLGGVRGVLLPARADRSAMSCPRLDVIEPGIAGLSRSSA